MAISVQNIELLKIIIDTSSDVNGPVTVSQGDDEPIAQTALRFVIITMPRSVLQLEIVRIFLAAGADIDVPKNTRAGASTLEPAIWMGDEELEILLKESQM